MFGRKKKEKNDVGMKTDKNSVSNCSACSKPGEKCCGGKRTTKQLPPKKDQIGLFLFYIPLVWEIDYKLDFLSASKMCER